MLRLVKLIAERDYDGLAQPDLRVFHVEARLAAAIASWYRVRGWTVTEEPI